MTARQPPIPKEQTSQKGPGSAKPARVKPEHEPVPGEDMGEESRDGGEARGDNIEQNTRNQGFRQNK